MPINAVIESKAEVTTKTPTEKEIIPHQSMPVVTASAGFVVLSVCILVVAFMSHKKRLSSKRRVRFFSVQIFHLEKQYLRFSDVH
jgi:hypothetical protein